MECGGKRSATPPFPRSSKPRRASPAAAQVANNLPNGPRVATRNPSSPLRLDFEHDWRRVIELKFATKGHQVGPLGREHAVPLSARLAGIQTLFRLLKRAGERFGHS